LSGHFRLIRELPAGTSFLKKLITIAEFVFIVAPPIQFNIVVRPSSVNTQCIKNEPTFASLLDDNHRRKSLRGMASKQLEGDFQRPFCFRKNSANAKACSGRFPARKSTSATLHRWKEA
jgi:hypothetical protein